MYSNFNIKKDKDLIVLNYYIEQNVERNLVSLSASLIAEILGIDRTKAYRLIKKLEDLKVIKCIKKGTGGSVLSIYEYVYATDNETGKSSNLKVCKINNEIGCEIEDAMEGDFYLNKYGKMYKSVHKRSSNIQLRKLQEIEGLNDIDMELFEYLLAIQKDDNSIKSKYKYFVKTIENAVKDKIFSLAQYKEDQHKRYNMKNNEVTVKQFDYIDNSDKDDFEALAQLSRQR